jgi:hypothetical protein
MPRPPVVIPCISVFDELWAYTSERSRRLWDELIPVPTKKISCRLVVTHAGFEGESVLLQELYQRGLQLPLVGPDLHAGDGMLMFWSHVPIAPWQDATWQAEMRRDLRPHQRAHGRKSFHQRRQGLRQHGRFRRLC